ncbi:hypothetical protein BH10PSE12_BH10PSE12_01820 [soil metagenome]
MAGANKKGRTKADARHIRLYHSFTASTAWQDLSGNAVKLLIELLRLDKGEDNGRLFLSIRDAQRIGVHRNTVVRLYRELEDHGFIRPTSLGHFKVKGGPATEWRVTWKPVITDRDQPNIPPTRDFENWEAPIENKTRAQKSSKDGTKIVQNTITSPKSGTKIVPPSTAASRIPDAVAGCETVPQVVYHGDHGSDADRQHDRPPIAPVAAEGGISATVIRLQFDTVLSGEAPAPLSAAPTRATSPLHAEFVQLVGHLPGRAIRSLSKSSKVSVRELWAFLDTDVLTPANRAILSTAIYQIQKSPISNLAAYRDVKEAV